MNEMIERAAKAHYEKLRKEAIEKGFVPAWEELSPVAKALRIAPMRAAIAAMREMSERTDLAELLFPEGPTPETLGRVIAYSIFCRLSNTAERQDGAIVDGNPMLGEHTVVHGKFDLDEIGMIISEVAKIAYGRD